MSTLARLRFAPAQAVASMWRGGVRTVPAAVVTDSELIHLGGGETLPVPGVEGLPLASMARDLGLGSPSLSLPAAKVHVLPDAVVCPGSRVVRDAANRVVSESMTADMVGEVDMGEAELRQPPIELSGNVALFRSPWRPRYHSLIDHLPRAALLSQPALRRLGPITLVHDGPLNDFEQMLLPSLLSPQITLREVDPERAIHADRVLLPGYVTRAAAGAIPSWYRRWVDHHVSKVPAAPAGTLPRRVFVERTSNGRVVLNRPELDRVLDAHGIQTIDLTRLSAVDQVRCFRDAELVVGATGSGLVNVLFSSTARVVELVPGRELLPHCFYLCASKGLPYEHVLSPPDHLRLGPERRLQHDLVVDAEQLDRVLSRSA